MASSETLDEIREQLKGTGWSIGVSPRPDGQWSWIAWPGPAGRGNPAYVAARALGPSQVAPTEEEALRAAVEEAIWQSTTPDL